jgi:hypothetical protein
VPEPSVVDACREFGRKIGRAVRAETPAAA